MKIRSAIARLAAIGAVKRKGLAGLQGYGGSVAGKGKIKRKDGDVTDFEIEGGAATKR